MSRGSATILITVLVLLLVGGFVGFYFYLQRGSEEGGAISPTPSGDLFPFPAGGATPGGKPPGAGGALEGRATAGKVPRLRQLSSEPVSGAIIFNRESEVVIRYLERKTVARFYETTKNSLEKKYLASMDIPRVTYESFFVEKGSAAILRYLKDDGDTIENYYARLVEPRLSTSSPRFSESSALIADKEIEGVFLPGTISALASSPLGEKIFYLSRIGNESVGFVAAPDNSKKTEVWSSSLRELLVSWPSTNTITLLTKPSAESAGYLFSLNHKNGRFEKIIGGMNGLNALLNPSGATLIYSATTKTGITTSLYNLATRKSTPLRDQTVPLEKCVWGKKKTSVIYCGVPMQTISGANPDAWYQGKVSFNDELVKIDAVTGESETILSPKEVAGIDMDITNPLIDSEDSLIVFQNKKDLSLWAFILEESASIDTAPPASTQKKPAPREDPIE